MHQALNEIISDVQPGCVFDSHYVIAMLLQKHSDEYLNFAKALSPKKLKTCDIHGKIGQEIAKLEGKLIEKLPDGSWSLNIHQTPSICTAWRKIR